MEVVLRKPRAELVRLREDRTLLGQVARAGAEKVQEYSDEMKKI